MTAMHPSAHDEDITRLLRQARDGEREAWAHLLQCTYGDLKRLAHRMLSRDASAPTLNTTGLLNEWYLRFSHAEGVPESRRHFFALSAKIMRQVMCSYARERLAIKRGGEWQRVDLGELDARADAESLGFVALDQALDALAAENEALVRVVECRFFAGMSEVETAEAVGVSLRSVQRLWFQARAQLAQLLEPR
ncbi:RNA polymerase sigma factor [Dokdonella koreensis DS-123]|uniref:RNA polymerase sigma factor n=2 Tax=Dokdonella TaxID=323413 RepID=A0A167G7V7_9GAMM|nr:RNA polymerase sigma factor [Dokdonella koreensis DS-123]